MTLDEAIKHCKEKAEELRKDADYLDAPYGMDTSARTDCLECANEHEQLAEWLEELKEWRKLKDERRCGMSECELCWQTGTYDDNCFCMLCPHRDECSGSDIKEDD